MRVVLFIATLAALAGCLDFSPMTGAKSPSSTSASSRSPSGNTSLDPTAPDCPDSHTPCLGDRECTFDTARECMVCTCASPLGPTPPVGGVPPL